MKAPCWGKMILGSSRPIFLARILVNFRKGIIKANRSKVTEVNGVFLLGIRKIIVPKGGT